MTTRAWGRAFVRTGRGGGGQIARVIAASVDLRFSLTGDVLAATIGERAAVAGLPAEEFAAHASLDDLYLATACAAGDAAAWAECEAKHFAFIRAFAHRFLPDADARDLADEVIADLWQRGKMARYSGRSTLRTWLGSVVAHAAINARRSVRTSRPLPANSQAPHVDVRAEDAPAERLLAELIGRAISGLPPEEKLLLQLHYEQGLTLDQMGGVVHASKATLSRRLAALRAKIREAVDDLAARSAGASAQGVREGLRLERIEFDLSTLLRPGAAAEGRGRDGV